MTDRVAHRNTFTARVKCPVSGKQFVFPVRSVRKDPLHRIICGAVLTNNHGKNPYTFR